MGPAVSGSVDSKNAHGEGIIWRTVHSQHPLQPHRGPQYRYKNRVPVVLGTRLFVVPRLRALPAFEINAGLCVGV